jgi:hypothetical protein
MAQPTIGIERSGDNLSKLTETVDVGAIEDFFGAQQKR